VAPQKTTPLAHDLAAVAALLLATLGTIAALSYTRIALWPVLVRLHYNDFGRFFYSTLSFETGGNMYAPSAATPVPFGNGEFVQYLDMNPPHLHALLVPLTGLSIERAFAIWAAAGLACLLASLVVIARELRLNWTVQGFTWTLFGVAASAATGATVVTGQLTFLLLLPVTLAWRAARRNDWPRSGWYLGVLMTLKPFLGVFVLEAVWTRQWKVVWRMAIAGATTAVVGLLAFGIHPYIDWVHALRAVSWLWAPMNGSLFGLASKAFDGGPMFRPIAENPDLVRPLATAVSLCLVAVTLVGLQRTRSPKAADQAFLAVLLLAQLISPLGWVYYLWLGAGPAAGLWVTSRQRPSMLRDSLVILAAPGFFLPVLATVGWSSARWSGITLGSAYTWTTLLLWSAVMIDAGLQETRSLEGAGQIAPA
jgi:hypothetical protein